MMDASDWMTAHNVGDVIGATVSGVDIENLETCVVYKMKKSRAVSVLELPVSYSPSYTHISNLHNIQTVLINEIPLTLTAFHCPPFLCLLGYLQ